MGRDFFGYVCGCEPAYGRDHNIWFFIDKKTKINNSYAELFIDKKPKINNSDAEFFIDKKPKINNSYAETYFHM